MAKVIHMPTDDAAWMWRRAYRAAHPGRGCRLYRLALRQNTATKARVQRLLSIRKGAETRRLQRLVNETAARVCRPFPDTRRMALRRKAWLDAVLIMKYLGGVEPKIGGPAIIEGPILTRVWVRNKWRKATLSRIPMSLHLAGDNEGADPRTVRSEAPFSFSLWTAVLLARAGCTWEGLCVPFEPYFDHPIPWLVEERELSFGEAIEHCRHWAEIGTTLALMDRPAAPEASCSGGAPRPA